MLKAPSQFELKDTPAALAARILSIIDEVNHLKDLDSILDKILHETRSLAKADAGSIFLVDAPGMLRFSYVQNNTLFTGDTTSKALYTDFRIPINEHSIVGYVARTQQPLALNDVYELPPEVPYTFNRTFDEKSGYRTCSMFTIPLTTFHNKFVGVMQLINAQNESGNTVPFSAETQAFASLLAYYAAVSVDRGIMTRELVLRMVRMAELRDPCETGAHVQRVGAYSAEIYKQIALKRHHAAMQKKGKASTSVPEEIKQMTDTIRLAAMLHDVGKVGIPDSILKKPAALDPEERKVMEQHTVYGARLFENAASELDAMCGDIARCHHERWDGNGYPAGRCEAGDPARCNHKGKDIPLAARIASLADVYDALSSTRVYKPSWPEEDVYSYIRAESGKQFDPEVVDAFFDIIDVIAAIRGKYRDEE